MILLYKVYYAKKKKKKERKLTSYDLQKIIKRAEKENYLLKHIYKTVANY